MTDRERLLELSSAVVEAWVWRGCPPEEESPILCKAVKLAAQVLLDSGLQKIVAG